MSRQENSPGQGSYSPSTSEASEDMYYSHRKTRDTPQHEEWQEKREETPSNGTVAERNVRMTALGGQGRARKR